MPGARTRPGLVREALLDGRVFWEYTGVQGFVQQWCLSARNSHPLFMIWKGHRLSPLTSCERRTEGIFQLLSGFTVLLVIQESLLLQNFFGRDCALYESGIVPQRLPGSEDYAPGGPQASNSTLDVVCDVLRRENIPDVPLLGLHVQLNTFAVSVIASIILTAIMNTVSTCLAAIRAPCLRRWVDFPLKDSYGLHPSRSRGHRAACSRGGRCSVLAPCFGRSGWCGADGACSRVAGSCSFQVLSVYVRLTFLVGLLALSAGLLLVRWQISGSDSATDNVVHDVFAVLSAYAQSLFVNHFASSLALHTPLWLCAAQCGARLGWSEFPLPFRMVMASHRVPFPEEAVAQAVARAPRVQRRVAQGPASRATQGIYTEFVGDSLREAVDAAVARFDKEVAKRDRFGRVLRLGRAVGGTVRRGISAMNPIVSEGGTAPTARPPPAQDAALADPLTTNVSSGAGSDVEQEESGAETSDRIELVQLITDKP